MAISLQSKLRFRARNRAKSKSKLSQLSRRREAYASSPIALNTRLPLWRKLYDYQRPGVKLALEHEGCCLFLEQRVGKTFVTLAVIEQLVSEYGTKFAGIVVVPKANKMTTWFKQMHEHLGVNVCLNWEAFKKARLKPRILLIHFEQLKANIARWPGWTFACFDESQRLAKRSGVASRRARMLRTADRRMILSGTPMDAEPMEMWAQFRFAIPHLFGEDWGSFVEEFGETYGWMGTKYRIREDKIDEFHELVSPFCLRVEKKDLGHDGPIVHPIYFDLGSKEQEIYDELEEEMIADLSPKRRVTAGLTVTQVAKLQQITSGFVIDDDGEIAEIGATKLRKCRMLLRQLRLPIVVFCRYRRDIDIVVESAKDFFDSSRIGQIRGGPKFAKQRDQTQNDFQAGKLDLCVAQIKAGGVGIDLFRGKRGIIMSCTFSWRDYDQAKARMDLIGDDQVELFHLVARNTVDEDIYLALQNKKSVTETSLNRLKRRGP